ncbi:stalk domain-containing protein [Paenibacillus gorillae]|uniref:stalk domain-containing protein n=1 Tax=Paenibacillus gorillae TaxID=1243662 RepID=UPI0004B83453|nr:stalk domain-containing protein [Paenibacillus gorillae]
MRTLRLKMLLSTCITASLLLAPLSGGIANAAVAPVSSATKLAAPATIAKPISVYVDDKKLTLTTAPFTQDGVTLVPMRPIFDALGANVSWEATTETIIGSKFGVSISLKVGKKTAIVNGKPVKLDAAPLVRNGVTYVPARFIAEALDANVKWNSKDSSIRITTKEYENWKLYQQIMKDAEASRVKLTTAQLVEEYDDSVVTITTNRALGSGIVVGKYWILTNYHVMEDASSATVVTLNGDELEVAGVAAANEKADLAIIQMKEPLDATPVSLGYDLFSRKGDKVIAIGSPLGLQNTVSDGLISNFIYENGVRYIQTSAPIDHGSSGGALFNEYGELIGITSAGITSNADLNFAVAVSHATLMLGNLGNKPAANVKFLDPTLPATLVGESEDTIRKLMDKHFSAVQMQDGTAKFTDWSVKRDSEGWLVISANIDPSFYMQYGSSIAAELRSWSINIGAELNRMLPDEKIQFLVKFDRTYGFKPRGYAADEVTDLGNDKWRLAFTVVDLQVKNSLIIKVRD